MEQTRAGIQAPPIVGGDPEEEQRFRPGPASEAELPFTRKPMVSWFDPKQLSQTAVRTVISDIFGSYADKRELQAALSLPEVESYCDEDELWIDYVADLGDGFDSTYSLAWLLSRDRLTVQTPKGPLETERGRILVMGGDQVYPTASREEYRDRLAGPYEAALPCEPGKHPHLYAIPGNHDWYDGLTAFLRQFAQGRWIGGWETRQSRSYFALQLCRGWWLWGIDVQLDSDVDDPQLRYFKAVARCGEGTEDDPNRELQLPDDRRMQPGDRVILCTAEPSWVFTAHDGKAYDVLEFLERTIIRPAGVTLALTLTGDLHHYARYVDETGTQQKITAGGGGAYLYPTHHIPEKLELDYRRGKTDRWKAPEVKVGYELKKTFPSREESRGLVDGVRSVGEKNPGFALLLGIAYAAIGFFLQVLAWPVFREPEFWDKAATTLAAPFSPGVAFWSSLRRTYEVVADNFWQPLTLLSGIIVLTLGTALVVGMWGLTRINPGARSPAMDRAGWEHGIRHAVFIFVAAMVLAALNFGLVREFLGSVVGFRTGGVRMFAAHFLLLLLSLWPLYRMGRGVGCWIFSRYLRRADRIGLNANEVFSAQGIEDYKNFIRLRIDAKGLTVFPMGVRKANHRWKFVERAGIGKSWFVPEKDCAPEPELIEEPIFIPHDHRTVFPRVGG